MFFEWLKVVRRFIGKDEIFQAFSIPLLIKLVVSEIKNYPLHTKEETIRVNHFYFISESEFHPP